jgi:hypothetical protein
MFDLLYGIEKSIIWIDHSWIIIVAYNFRDGMT